MKRTVDSLLGLVQVRKGKLAKRAGQTRVPTLTIVPGLVLLPSLPRRLNKHVHIGKLCNILGERSKHVFPAARQTQDGRCADVGCLAKARVPVYYFRGGQEGGETFARRGRVPVGRAPSGEAAH